MEFWRNVVVNVKVRPWTLELKSQAATEAELKELGEKGAPSRYRPLFPSTILRAKGTGPEKPGIQRHFDLELLFDIHRLSANGLVDHRIFAASL